MFMNAHRSAPLDSCRTPLASRRPGRSRPRLAPALAGLFDDLDHRLEALPLPEFAVWLAHYPIRVDDVAPFVAFSERRYTRNPVRVTERWQALVLCWRRGQHSPIHDHRGSLCAFKVLRGTAFEVLYDLTPDGRALFRRAHELPPSGVSAQADADIHRVIAVEELITLHLYAPPLTAMRVYDEALPLR